MKLYRCMHHIEAMCNGTYWLKEMFLKGFNCGLLKKDTYLNNSFMLYLLQLHINPFSKWHFGRGIRVLWTLFLVVFWIFMKHWRNFVKKKLKDIDTFTFFCIRLILTEFCCQSKQQNLKIIKSVDLRMKSSQMCVTFTGDYLRELSWDL